MVNKDYQMHTLTFTAVTQNNHDTGRPSRKSRHTTNITVKATALVNCVIVLQRKKMLLY